MIAHLKGVIREKSAGRLVVDVSGVGYEVLIPFSTYYELGEIGETVSLRIYTHVKEDALKLYGFLTSKEKKLFTQLIQVSGIGPKLGVTILSGLPVDEFVEAVMDGDVVTLNRIPGVGKKTAERLVVEMKDKVVELFPEVEEAKKEGVPGSLQADVVSALVNLGYPRNAAEKAVAKALEEGHTDRFEELLRKSLRRIRA
ncbi:MAG: Holliday junction branch migration protein RuvA [Acidobacteriota bacterium]